MLRFICFFWAASAAAVCAGQLTRGPAIGCRKVVDVEWSPDGRYMAASYYVDAPDRGQTMWQAWVEVWDLDTGEQKTIENATGPLAISPNGRWLAMGTYERKKVGRQMRPLSELAIWKLGDVKPTRKLACDLKPGEWKDWTFSSDGAELLALSNHCELYRWDIAEDTPAEKIETFSLPDTDERADATGYSWPTWPSHAVDLHAMGDELHLFASVTTKYVAPGKTSAVEVLWKKTAKNWHRQHVWEVLSPSGFEAEIKDSSQAFKPSFDCSLPPRLALAYMKNRTAPGIFYWAQLCRLVLSPSEEMAALIEPGTSLATVMRSGEQLTQFPAADVQAFTLDGKQLVTSDHRGVLRFWDIDSGRIARTLSPHGVPSNTFLVAAVQAASEFGRPDRNREYLSLFVAQAAYAGAQIVVLPETAVTGYMSDDILSTWQVGDRQIAPDLEGCDPKDVAETVPGPSTRYFAEVARQWGIYLTVPLLEVDRKTGKHYNTVVLLGPDGRTLIHYRKVNPWPWAERGWASAGNLGHAIVDTPFGRLGVLICFDIHAQAEELSKLKIDTLLYSVAWVDDKGSDWFSKRLPEIAALNEFNIVAANWTVAKLDPKPTWYGYGQSTVIDKSGQVLANVAPQRLIGYGTGPYAQSIILAELPLPEE